MFKTLTAAVIAVSVLAAPAFAGGINHTARAPHGHVVGAKVLDAKVLNAKAKMHRVHGHHRHHVRAHFNLHNKFSLHKSVKHTAQSAKIVRKHG